jgi:peptidoglycan-N-acetylglucosamine deacetylase
MFTCRDKAESCILCSDMISIVVPALNEEKLIPLCLESLKKQKCNVEYEIIVVDNGSTDKTIQVAKDNGVRVVSCPKRGVAFARQAGAEAAQGEIIIQVDADTIYPAGWLEKIAASFTKHDKTVAIAGRYVYTNPSWWAPWETFYRRSLNQLGLMILRFPAAVSGANFAFKKEAFMKTGGYDVKSLYPDQWGIARQLHKYGRIYYVHDIIAITSKRRIAKPWYVIFYEIGRNICHVMVHLIKHCAGMFKKSYRR